MNFEKIPNYSNKIKINSEFTRVSNVALNFLICK
jgi:hypothetical protein